MRLLDRIFGNRICFVADGTSGGGTTSASGSATGSASSEATASASATGEATTSASGEANADTYVSPFTIVYRKDLDRPLTSEEVDNNFAQIDNMYKMLLKAEKEIYTDIKITAEKLEGKIIDGVSEAKSYAFQVTDEIANKLDSIEDDIDVIIDDIDSLKERQKSLLETQVKFDMAFGQFFEKDENGNDVFNATEFGNAVKSTILPNLDDTDILLLKSKVGVSALEDRLGQDETRLTNVEGRTAINESTINTIKNAIAPFMTSDGSAIDIEKLANTLATIFDDRYAPKQESTSGEATASESESGSGETETSDNGTANESGSASATGDTNETNESESTTGSASGDATTSDSATASGSGSANGEG